MLLIYLKTVIKMVKKRLTEYHFSNYFSKKFIQSNFLSSYENVISIKKEMVSNILMSVGSPV